MCLPFISLCIENKRLVDFVINGESKYLRYRENSRMLSKQNKSSIRLLVSSFILLRIILSIRDISLLLVGEKDTKN